MSRLEPFEIRKMAEWDLEAVDAIQAASLPNAAAGWKARDFLAHLSFVAISSGEVAGFLVSRQTVEDEYEVLNMAVAPKQRRRGCGRAMLEFVLKTHPGIWFLDVRSSNAEAQALYESLGFHRCGLRHDFYREPLENAIEMTRSR